MKLSQQHMLQSNTGADRAHLDNLQRRITGATSLAELEQEAIADMQRDRIDIDHLELDVGFKRVPRHSEWWYAADTFNIEGGNYRLIVTYGDAKRTGDVSTPIGVYDSHRRDGRTLAPAEAQRLEQEIAKRKQTREEQDQQRRAESAIRDNEEWARAVAPGPSRYLEVKQIKNHDNYDWRQLGDDLLIPIRDIDGNLHGLQRISPNGEKRMSYGASVTGNFCRLGEISSKVIIAEGIATAASVHEATGECTLCAFFAGNLQAVAEAWRKRYPQADIVIAGDEDQFKEVNAGRDAATKAARAVNGRAVFPVFSDLSTRPTDFNDLMRLQGLDEVKRQLAQAGDTWPEPLPLPDALAPVESFRYELLPDSLADMVRDICERVQCPADFVGVSIMVALGAVVGRKIGIRPQQKTDWTVVANMWAMVVGRPGVLKSPAMEAALAPIKRLAADAIQQAEQDQLAHEMDLRVHKMRRQAAEKEAAKKLAKNPRADVEYLLEIDEPEEPTTRRYLINNTTAESLGELHRQNTNGLMVYRDEMVSLLKSLGREDQSEARGFYLTGWNGDSAYTFDRIGRGLNLYIPAVCLSMLGSTQPGRIAQYVRSAVTGGDGDDGLIQRFGLFVWPDITGKWCEVDRWPDNQAKQRAFEVFKYLDTLQPEQVQAEQDHDSDGNPDGMPYLRLDDNALALFKTWRHALEQRLRSGELHPAVESHLAKYRKLVPGLALLLHLSDRGVGSITERAMLQALAWAEYLESHAQRVYQSITAPEFDAAHAIIQRLRRGDLQPEFSSRDVWRPKWAKLTDRNVVHEALQMLQEYDWLTSEQHHTGGRPATVYRVNPRAMKGADS